jgi:L-alanine-DL-glutamate epimerase-like enolase superfamily enzyme
MKIAKIEDFHADGGWRTLSFLKITTDDGLVGWSEYCQGFGVGGVTEIIHKFAPLAKTFDPRDVGVLGESLRSHTRIVSGAITNQAVAAIENACLDIKAKALGVPVYALFGGAFRERLTLYWSHCGTMRAWNRDLFEKEFGREPIRTLDDLKRLGEEARARGFRAIKTNPMAMGPKAVPFSSGVRMAPGFLDRNLDRRVMMQMIDQLAAQRDGIGPETGLMFDLNFGLRTEGFIRVAKALERRAGDRHARSGGPGNGTALEFDADHLARIAARHAPVPAVFREPVGGCGRGGCALERRVGIGAHRHAGRGLRGGVRAA